MATYCDSIAPESACTVVQLHLQVAPAATSPRTGTPRRRCRRPQVALGANSPFFFGQRLWAETRIELFAQATDTRPVELKNQGVRPRVFFGERWITSIFDLFEENVRYFPALLAETSDEDPMAVLEAGERPRAGRAAAAQRHGLPLEPADLRHRRRHARTCAWRTACCPPARPSSTCWPTRRSTTACMRMLADEDRPVWTKMSFAAGEENFRRAARDGIDARLYWPGFGEVPADELVLRHLLPMAHEGLRRWGVSDAVRDRYLGVIEGRCKTGRQRRRVAEPRPCRRSRTPGCDRREALRRMLELYTVHMDSNEPVHTWPLP